MNVYNNISNINRMRMSKNFQVLQKQIKIEQDLMCYPSPNSGIIQIIIQDLKRVLISNYSFLKPAICECRKGCVSILQTEINSTNSDSVINDKEQEGQEQKQNLPEEATKLQCLIDTLQQYVQRLKGENMLVEKDRPKQREQNYQNKQVRIQLEQKNQQIKSLKKQLKNMKREEIQNYVKMTKIQIKLLEMDRHCEILNQQCQMLRGRLVKQREVNNKLSILIGNNIANLKKYRKYYDQSIQKYAINKECMDKSTMTEVKDKNPQKQVIIKQYEAKLKQTEQRTLEAEKKLMEAQKQKLNTIKENESLKKQMNSLKINDDMIQKLKMKIEQKRQAFQQLYRTYKKQKIEWIQNYMRINTQLKLKQKQCEMYQDRSYAYSLENQPTFQHQFKMSQASVTYLQKHIEDMKKQHRMETQQLHKIIQKQKNVRDEYADKYEELKKSSRTGMKTEVIKNLKLMRNITQHQKQDEDENQSPGLGQQIKINFTNSMTIGPKEENKCFYHQNEDFLNSGHNTRQGRNHDERTIECPVIYYQCSQSGISGEKQKGICQQLRSVGNKVEEKGIETGQIIQIPILGIKKLTFDSNQQQENKDMRLIDVEERKIIDNEII